MIILPIKLEDRSLNQQQVRRNREVLSHHPSPDRPLRHRHRPVCNPIDQTGCWHPPDHACVRRHRGGPPPGSCHRGKYCSASRGGLRPHQRSGGLHPLRQVPAKPPSHGGGDLPPRPRVHAGGGRPLPAQPSLRGVGGVPPPRGPSGSDHPNRQAPLGAGPGRDRSQSDSWQDDRSLRTAIEHQLGGEVSHWPDAGPSRLRHPAEESNPTNVGSPMQGPQLPASHEGRDESDKK